MVWYSPWKHLRFKLSFPWKTAYNAASFYFYQEWAYTSSYLLIFLPAIGNTFIYLFYVVINLCSRPCICHCKYKQWDIKAPFLWLSPSQIGLLHHCCFEDFKDFQDLPRNNYSEPLPEPPIFSFLSLMIAHIWTLNYNLLCFFQVFYLHTHISFLQLY